MKFIPYSRYTITTYLTENEVMQKLSEQIEPVIPNRYFKNEVIYEKPYEGTISNQYFEIKRISLISHKSPTIITGCIQKKSGKTEIEIKMRLSVFTLILMSFFLILILTFYYEIIMKLIKSNTIEPVGLIGSFFLFSIGFILPLWTFNYESEKSMRFFSDLLEEENSGKNY